MMRRSRAARALFTILASVFAITAVLASAAAARSASRPHPDVVSGEATVGLGAPGRSVPPSFLGLSIETSDLARYEAEPAFPRFLSNLRSAGGAVGLRIGGQSADSSSEQPGLARAGGYTLDDAWFQGLSRLADQVPLRVIFGLNLPVRSPSIAVAEARDVLRALPGGDLAGFEVGNEPDLYARGMVGFARPGPLLPTWAPTYTPVDYAHDFKAYATAVRAVAPRVPIAGPATAFPGTAWWSSLPRQGSARLGMVTVHRYPLSACTATPTLSGLMSGPLLAAFTATVADEAASAHAVGLPLRVTEANSASCGGLEGVSDTFASALWGPDALLGMFAAGADGVDIHTRVDAFNTPLQGRPSLLARPLFYGLVLAARMLVPGAQLQETVRHGGAGLSTWAVRDPDGTERVLLINKSENAVRTALVIPHAGAARVLALRAPSLRSTAQVTLGGQWLDSSGHWQGTSTAATVSPQAGTYHLTVVGDSALLVTAPAR